MKEIKTGTILVGKKGNDLIMDEQVLVRVDAVDGDRVNITIIGHESPKRKGLVGAVATGLSVDCFEVASDADLERIEH